MRTTLSITSTDATTGKASTKSYGNIIPGYVGVIGGQAPALPYQTVDGSASAGIRVASFAAWSQQIAQRILALSTDSYSDCTVTCAIGVNEELAGGE